VTEILLKVALNTIKQTNKPASLHNNLFLGELYDQDAADLQIKVIKFVSFLEIN
jgi:hypothetical protein